MTLAPRLQAALQAMGYPVPALPPVLTSLTLDSRRVAPGAIFCAVTGRSQDGRAFLADACAQGAALVLLPEGPRPEDRAALGSVPAVALPGMEGRLSELAHHVHGAPSESMTVIGVTGTNGKTSVVSHCAALLSALGVPTATFGTLGVGFGDALTSTGLTTADPFTVQAELRRLRDEGAEAVAMEVSSHALDQGRVQSVAFDAAVMTNLSRDHLDYHGTLEAYGEAKRQLFLQPGLAHGVLNLEDPFCRKLLGRIPCAVKTHSYALEAPDAAVHLTARRPCGQGWAFQGQSPWGAFAGATGLIGAHGLSNLLAALTTLAALGYPLSELTPLLAKVPAAPGRLERFAHPSGVEIFVDYAHTPEALSAALAALRAPGVGRLHCIFGCGGERDRGKRPLMGAAAAVADALYLTNDNPRGEDPDAILCAIAQGIPAGVPVQRIPDRAEALAAALAEARPGDRILLAGKGHETVQIGAEGPRPFSDRALAAALCAGEGA
jgi:UDP-N-acetylmuramoyl-L-alanyl-D-glutamate--2,6-diaminopimelate ligase